MLIFSQNKALILGLGISSLLHVGVIVGGQIIPQPSQMNVLNSENTNSFQIISLPTVVISPEVMNEEGLIEKLVKVNNIDKPEQNSRTYSPEDLSNSLIEQIEQSNIEKKLRGHYKSLN